MSSSILSKALQATSLLASTTLVALSIATVALVTHYSESMDASYPEGSYTYYGPVGSPARRAYWEEYDAGNRDFNKVYMQYVTSNDIWILVSGCVGLVAGVVGWLTVAFMMMKEKVCLSILIQDFGRNIADTSFRTPRPQAHASHGY